MRIRWWMGGAAAMAVGMLVASSVLAQDWPQWRGATRDGKVAGFKAPAAWPKELTQKWKVQVGNDDASPVLVGDKVYVFTRQGDDEVTLCLNAADGKEIWRDKNPVSAMAISGPAARAHGGPRATPVVVDGKVITLGVTGVVSCLDGKVLSAAKGVESALNALGSKVTATVDNGVVWRKNDIKGVPKFFTSSSPLVTYYMKTPLVIAQLGPEGTGAIVAYGLYSDKVGWKAENQGASYASPVVATIEGKQQIVALTDMAVVGLDAADGKVLWQYAFAPKGRMEYNAATPIVDGSTVIVSGAGRGTVALKIAKKDDAFTATEAWTSPTAVLFCTPLLKDGFIYGVSDKGNLFCLSAKDGSAVWTGPGKLDKFGNLLDLGSAVMVLPSTGELLIIKPGEKQYTELAKYKVAETATYACPIVAGNRIFVKDADSLILWSLEAGAAKEEGKK